MHHSRTQGLNFLFQVFLIDNRGCIHIYKPSSSSHTYVLAPAAAALPRRWWWWCCDVHAWRHLHSHLACQMARGNYLSLNIYMPLSLHMFEPAMSLDGHVESRFSSIQSRWTFQRLTTPLDLLMLCLVFFLPTPTPQAGNGADGFCLAVAKACCMPLFVSFQIGHVTLSFPQELSVSLNHLHCVHRALHALAKASSIQAIGSILVLSSRAFQMHFLHFLRSCAAISDPIAAVSHPLQFNTRKVSYSFHLFLKRAFVFPPSTCTLPLAPRRMALRSRRRCQWPAWCPTLTRRPAPGYHSASQGKEIKEGR